MGLAKPRNDIDLPKSSFMEKFDVREDGCWEWTACKIRGYGVFRKWRAHRASWLIFKGEDPGALHVCHSCDNPGCVNPDHLFLGDPKVNAEDRERKGRGNNLRGQSHGSAKLTNEEVAEIKRLVKSRLLPQKRIAKLYGTTQSNVSHIGRGKYWKSVNVSS